MHHRVLRRASLQLIADVGIVHMSTVLWKARQNPQPPSWSMRTMIILARAASQAVAESAAALGHYILRNWVRYSA